ncbi:MAG: DNA helicase-2/ATP-dependent DNA helicase PcrA [Mariniblastus sp.]|jgi:DNA helicase-2/ATP-dependent DNA helicase PcrA
MPNVTTDEILAPLNEQQRLAVAQLEGPLLILAGPGSGKTRVITHRIANMIAHGIASQSIVALTFTNKAADEMKSRLKKLAPDNHTWTGTFHKFCSKLLRRHAPLIGLEPNFSIYDMTDSKKVIKQAIENSDVDLKHYSADKLASQISNVKNNGVTSEHFQPRPGHALDAILGKVYPEYQRLLKMANGVDFDDLLLHAVDLLRQSPELRETLDHAFTYMMVDEYQDTNLTQYQLIRLLNHSVQNLAVTGDPDQSIYGWRGANISNILEFEKDYPQLNVVRLEQNYRSSKSILRVADQLIGNNVRRKKKELRTDNDEGNPVRLVTFPSPKDESIDIADSIALAIQRGELRPRDVAILYRANWLSRSLEHSLRSVGIPYQIVNGHEFYQRKEIKDLIGYLHLLNNPRDNVAFERVVNTPSRKIGNVTLGRLRRFSQEHNISMLDAARECDQIDTISKAPSSKIRQFVALYDRLSYLPTESVEFIVRSVLEETKYREWLTDDGSEEGFERANNVDELVVACSEFDRDFADGGGLETYLEQSALVSDTDIWQSDSDFVTLMSLHAAKGLEFPSVYIVGLEDGILPHERSSGDDDQLEEERRLLFVGITRAERELQISRCMSRFRRGSFWPSIASRFLMELPREEMQIFEPASNDSGVNAAADSISQLDPWMDDGLPAIDINATEEQKFDSDFSDDHDEPKNSTQVKESSTSKTLVSKPTIARIVTGAQMAAEQEASKHVRLDPESYRLGMEVEHAEYGPGTLIELTGEGPKRTATIDFEQLGKKRFRLAFCNLRVM